MLGDSLGQSELSTLHYENSAYLLPLLEKRLSVEQAPFLKSQCDGLKRDTPKGGELGDAGEEEELASVISLQLCGQQIFVSLFGDGQEVALLNGYGISSPETYLAHHLPETTALLDHTNNLLDELSGYGAFLGLFILLFLWDLEECGEDLLLIQILLSFLLLNRSYLLGDGQLHPTLNHDIKIVRSLLHPIHVFLGIPMCILHPLCQFGHQFVIMGKIGEEGEFLQQEDELVNCPEGSQGGRGGLLAEGDEEGVWGTTGEGVDDRGVGATGGVKTVTHLMLQLTCIHWPSSYNQQTIFIHPISLQTMFNLCFEGILNQNQQSRMIK